jgi:hypothetical protein
MPAQDPRKFSHVSKNELRRLTAFDCSETTVDCSEGDVDAVIFSPVSETVTAHYY